MDWNLVLETLLETVSYKWASGTWLLLNLLVIFYCIYKKANSSTRINCGITMIMTLLVVFCPAVIFFMRKYFISSSHIYIRIAWGMLSVPTIAYGLTEVLYKEGEKRWNYRSAIAILLSMLVLAGNNSSVYFKVPSNIYKVPYESKQIADYMTDKRVDDKSLVGICFRVDSDENVTPEEYIYQGLRCYGDHYSFAPISEVLLQNYEYEYVIAPLDYPGEWLEEYGYMLTKQYETLEVYSYHR